MEVETPMYRSPAQRVRDINFTSTSVVTALRQFSDHPAVHPNAGWRRRRGTTQVPLEAARRWR